MAETVTIPKEEYEALVKRLAVVEQGLLQTVGLDPVIAKRAAMGYKLVQFTRPYTRGAIPSNVQKGAMVFPRYSASTGSVVYLKDDEVKRLNNTFQGLLVMNRNKFEDKPHFEAERHRDDKTGIIGYQWVSRPIKVEVLLKQAEEYKLG